ncbi:MAG: type II secretion system protein GspD [Deltaproteobacteria bacterium]|nr:type II secretion system protein GspD [Deltaproteobacteria bacterium]
MRNCLNFVGKRLKGGWLSSLVPLSIILGVTGCASTQAVAPPQPPAPIRTPVRVIAPSPKPPPAYAKAGKKADAEDRLEERNLESLTARIKKMPVTRRTPPKGETVYPIDLNLKNADLVEAIRVLADTMGLNYNIDPKVKGTVNVRASGKLSKSELLSIMETILTINGATMIKNNELYNIVPADKAATRGLPVYSQGAIPPGMRAQVVFLEQTPAKEVLAMLKPLMSPAGNIGQAAHNSLVLIDNPENLDKLLRLIYLVDTRALADTLVRIVKVHNTDPTEIITEMETIFSAYGNLAQKGKESFGVSFLPVARLNSVMILANSQPLAERALYWVKQLDAKTDLLANVHIYHVLNYKAKNLADLLTQVYGGAPPAPKIKESKLEGGASFSTSTIGGPGGVGGGLGGGGQSRGLMGGAAGGASGMSGAGSTQGAMGSPGGDAGGAIASLKERATGMGGGAQGTSPKEGVRIIPDEENNLLVVVAPPHEWNIISRLLTQLDIMPRQVLNEVLIAEVRLTDDLKYGIEFLIGGVPAAAQPATGTQTSSGVPSGVLVAGGQQPTTTTVTGPSGSSGTVSTAPANIPGVTMQSGASAAFTAAGGLTFVALDTVNKLKGLINLLAAEGKVNILASPHIMASNNQEARIMIGEEVPILTSQSTPLISQTTSFQTSTVQYRSTGIILTVKPQINAKGMVTLDIAQEVSDAKTTSTGVGGTPTFTVRQAKTSLITADNQTVVLGGLIREDNTHTQAGIPGLRKMPLLGPLFGSEGVSKQKTELLVLITPHIISNLEEGAHITHEMKEKVGLEETLPKRTPGTPAAPTSGSRETAPRPY